MVRTLSIALDWDGVADSKDAWPALDAGLLPFATADTRSTTVFNFSLRQSPAFDAELARYHGNGRALEGLASYAARHGWALSKTLLADAATGRPAGSSWDDASLAWVPSARPRALKLATAQMIVDSAVATASTDVVVVFVADNEGALDLALYATDVDDPRVTLVGLHATDGELVPYGERRL